MNIWIITTGSSDVQLTVKGNEGWNPLRNKVRNKMETPKPFEVSVSKSQDGKNRRFLYPARAVGVVYGNAIANDPSCYDDLDFPLLNNFFWILNGKDGEAEEIVVNRVIVMVTDQSDKFKPSEKDKPFSAFWQDTHTLEPILREYFKRRSIDNPEFLILDPDPKKPSGLDNWNDVLERVQEKFKEKFSDFEASEDLTVYVSHQAGTPAISSAVQFCSLAKFGDRVRFLVSNEDNRELTGFVESSSYLRGIKREQAKKLLENHDYAGVNSLVGEYLKGDEKTLLQAALQWNYAKFDDKDGFADELAKLVSQDFQGLVQIVDDRRQHWWWTAYEAAYLAFIRLDQKNAVEAFFHSFRAVEGLISRWTEVTYPEHVDSNNDSPQVKLSILEELPDYLSNKKQEHLLSEFKEKQKLGLHSFPLYDLLRKGKPDWRQQCKDLSVFTDQIAPKRNKLFHRLKGLEIVDVFQEWKVNDPEELEVRIRHYLNFISNQSFNSLKEASLMAIVHRELESAIAQL